MANIAISNLQLAGADLFLDSESFFNDLTDENMNVITGGLKPTLFVPVKPIFTTVQTTLYRGPFYYL